MILTDDEILDLMRVTFDDETASPKTLRPGTYLQFSVADCGTGIVTFLYQGLAGLE
mgnify:CR=1 FL=1